MVGPKGAEMPRPAAQPQGPRRPGNPMDWEPHERGPLVDFPPFFFFLQKRKKALIFLGGKGAAPGRKPASRAVRVSDWKANLQGLSVCPSRLRAHKTYSPFNPKELAKVRVAQGTELATL